MKSNFRIFGLNATKNFATEVAHHLDVELSDHVERYFDDHESYLRSSVNVRDCDVYVIQSLYDNEVESLSDKFIKILFFIGSLKDASAKRVTLITPHLAFARQDRKTESRSPITTKYVAKIIESMGTDRLLTMDNHNISALQNSFRIPTDNLEAKNLIADYVVELLEKEPEDNLCVLSPDSGGMGRAKRFRNALSEKLNKEIGLCYLDKSHTGSVIQGHNIIGDVKNKNVIAVDDMISSASTISECNKAIKREGGKLWAACATHALCVGKVNENLSEIDRIIVTDTIVPWRVSKEILSKFHIIPTSKIFSQAIRRIHQGGSLSALFK